MPVTDLVFDYIELSGFMSFSPRKNQRLTLNTNQLTTIIGENLDVGDGERNGAGKSLLINSLTYLYWGKSPRISNQGFLNYIEPGALFISGSASRNGIAFLVERGENPSVLRLFEKPIDDHRDWRLKENGKLVFECTKSTKPETSKRIVELIGFDIKLIDVLLFNDSSDRSCFFLKTEEDQRNIIERIFGFTIFTEKADNLREIRKEENKNLVTKESTLIATRQANERVMNEITQLEEKSLSWTLNLNDAVKSITKQLRDYQKIDFSHELKVLGDVNQLAQSILIFERDIKNHRSSLETAKQRQLNWQNEHNQNISILKNTIERLSTVDAASDITTIKNAEVLRSTAKEITTNLAVTMREAENYKQQHKAEYTNRSRLIKQIRIIETEIIQLSESKCPTCGQEWRDTKDHILHCIADLDTHNAEVVECDKLIQQFKVSLTNAISSAERLERQQEKVTKNIKELPPSFFKTIEDAVQAEASLEQSVQQLQIETAAINPHEQPLAELQTIITKTTDDCTNLRMRIAKQPKTTYSTLDDANVAKQLSDGLIRQLTEYKNMKNPYTETITNLHDNAIKDIDESEVAEIKNKIEHMNLLIKLLSDKDSPIRAEILNEWIPELNARLNQYLEFLELPHRVAFDANTTAAFTLNDHELGFGNLSTGQRLRVTLACNIALREVFELINHKINLFWIDETLDKGMSSRGAERSFELLENIVHKDKKSLFLISHRQELRDLSDNVITVQLENGLSTLL